MDCNGFSRPPSPSFQLPAIAQPVPQMPPEPPIFQSALPQPRLPMTPCPPHSPYSFTTPYAWPPAPSPSHLLAHPTAYSNQQWIQYQPRPHIQPSILGDSPSRNSHNAQIPSSSASQVQPTSTVANRGRSCKRNNNSSGQSRNVRQRINDPSQENHLPQTATAATTGAGPISSQTTQTTRITPDHPAYSNDGVFKSALLKPQGPSNTSATDVWFFIAPSHIKDTQVSQLPCKIYSDLPKKSEGEWLICKWCSDM
ncbi:hypothetical protein F5880DRAFT_1614252 [Lentinula raphanica]|nr:hypothetical protein F5880DRAFT_1614252 [Lentinula raphanica]